LLGYGDKLGTVGRGLPKIEGYLWGGRDASGRGKLSGGGESYLRKGGEGMPTVLRSGDGANLY